MLLFEYDVGTESLSLSESDDEQYYAPNQLYSNKTYDEHDNESIEYVDQEGRTVCNKVQYVIGGTEANTEKRCAETYYIYNDLGIC